jgi:DNA-binding NtrC family response regulator
VRELRNLVERLVILCPGEAIEEAHVADALPGPAPSAPRASTTPRTLREIMDDLERGVILDALERHGWTIAAAARELGLERSHLYKKMRALGIERP